MEELRDRSGQEVNGKLCDSPVFPFKTSMAALPLGQYECGRRRPEEKSLFRVSSRLEQMQRRQNKAFIFNFTHLTFHKNFPDVKIESMPEIN